MRIGVIGAGVLGLTIAYELDQRGHQVTVVEREHPFAGASHRSFAWVNANNKFPESYHRINALGVEEHRRLQERFSGQNVWLHLSGNILADFSGARSQTYAARVEGDQSVDYPVRRITRQELVHLEPAVAWPEDLEEALFYPTEGYLDNDILATELVAALDDRGVGVQRAEAERVDSDESSARVSFTDGSSEQFDRVVIAAGAASRQLAEQSGLSIPVADLSAPTARTHSLLGLTEPVGFGLSKVVISDRVNVRPRHDDRMWVQVPSVETRVSEGESPELLAEVAAVMEGELAALFGKSVQVEEVIFSGRSFPEDGKSIIGHLDRNQKVYGVATHSGMTLAALFARLTADELEGSRSDLLDDFRPGRFADGVGPSDDSGFIGKQ